MLAVHVLLAASPEAPKYDSNTKFFLFTSDVASIISVATITICIAILFVQTFA